MKQIIPILAISSQILILVVAFNKTDVLPNTITGFWSDLSRPYYLFINTCYLACSTAVFALANLFLVKSEKKRINYILVSAIPVLWLIGLVIFGNPF